MVCFYCVSLGNVLLLMFLEEFGYFLALLDLGFVRRVFWNFYCTIEREPLLDSFPSVFLTSENQAINEMPKGKRYFKVVEDKARYQKKGSKGENGGCATKLVGEKKNLSGFQGQIG